MLRTIHLHGALAKRFGATPFAMSVDDLQALFSGLEANFPGFRSELRQHKRVAIGLDTGGKIEFLTEERFAWSFGSANEIHIALDEHGAGAEAAAVVATEIVGTWASVSGWTAVAYAAVYVATIAALAYISSSLIKSLAEKPEVSRTGKEDPSPLFDQAVNLEGQGHPIPLLYGLFKCSTVVISADIVSEKNTFVVDDSSVGFLEQTLSGNIYDNDAGQGELTLLRFVIGGVTYAPGASYNSGGVTFTINANGDYSATCASVVELSVACISQGETTSGTESTLTLRWKAISTLEGSSSAGDIQSGNVFSNDPNSYGARVLAYTVLGVEYSPTRYPIGVTPDVALAVREDGSYQALAHGIASVQATITALNEVGAPMEPFLLVLNWT